MYSDDIVREHAAALQENAAAHRESVAASLKLAAAITAAVAQLRPTAGMSAAELQDLADEQRLKEPPAFDPTTHQGRVEQNVRKMLAMWHDND